MRGEGEVSAPQLLEAIPDRAVETIPGVVTLEGIGPPPLLLDSLDHHPPARDLVRQRHKYFIGALDPCASIEFTRGCPWDCTFCSAWTFYGRSYRQSTPEAVIEDLARIREPPGEKEARFLEAAGFAVQSRQGAAWTISGPPGRISRLLEDDRITFYERSLSQPGTPVKKDVPKASESLEDIKERELKEPSERKDRAIPSHRINRDGIKSAPPASKTDNNVK